MNDLDLETKDNLTNGRTYQKWLQVCHVGLTHSNPRPSVTRVSLQAQTMAKYATCHRPRRCRTKKHDERVRHGDT